jgi:Ras-related protein Rab-8A
MGILLVFDLTDERSFNNIRNWIHNTEQYASEGVNKILIGNKCDMNERRVIDRARAEALAAEYGIPYLETSAKARINVEESFMELAKDIKKRLIDGSAAAANAPNASGNVKLEEVADGPIDRMRGACCYGGGNGASTSSGQPYSRS